MPGPEVPTYAFSPYCGAPPSPASLIGRWNLDPLLLLALTLALAAYMIGAEPRLGGAVSRRLWRRACFYAGWALGALALVSPLCPLSVSLFSARVGQHMILVSAVAPLVALGRPGGAYGAAVGWTRTLRRAHAPRYGELIGAGVFTVALWYWHAPGPYTATFASDLVYWLMHLSVFGSAYALWASLLHKPAERIGAFLAAGLVTSVQMGFLGAVLTFASRPLFVPHLVTSAAWGLTPLEDQQLGGAIMWVPAGFILIVAVVAAFALALRRAGERAAARAFA